MGYAIVYLARNPPALRCTFFEAAVRIARVRMVFG
jgi:hypothetical protein